MKSKSVGKFTWPYVSVGEVNNSMFISSRINRAIQKIF